MFNWLREILFGAEWRAERQAMITQISDLREANVSLMEEIQTLREEVAKLKAVEDIPCPEWLDSRKTPYQPKVQVVSQSGGYESVTLPSQDIYAPSPTLESLVKSKGWKLMGHDDRLQSIWEYVCSRVDYAYDNGEAWNFPIVTNQRRKGDCEDSTILFVTLCRLSGVKGDSVFNALGWFKSSGQEFGHSWPVAKREDGKWYVYESTLSSAGTPKLFKGNANYFADWGLANWAFCGTLVEGNQI